MPLVTLTLRPGKPKDFKVAILGAAPRSRKRGFP